MQSDHAPLYYALAGTICFSSSSMVFALYSKKISALWMNSFKAIICFISLIIALTFSVGWVVPPSSYMAMLFLSGFLGLYLADLLLLGAYTKLGPARTLVLFGFQPLLIGIASHYFFGQDFSPQKLVAIFFLISCAGVFSLEKFKEHGHWEFSGLCLALFAILLDGIGVIITRYVFNNNPELHVLQGNFYRTVGAVVGFGIINFWKPIHLWGSFNTISHKGKIMVLTASFAGTFLSLLFYLTAVKNGHLASIGAVGLSGPMFATILESIIDKKRPSLYLIFAFILFLIGAGILYYS